MLSFVLGQNVHCCTFQLANGFCVTCLLVVLSFLQVFYSFSHYISKITVSYFLILRGSLVVEVY